IRKKFKDSPDLTDSDNPELAAEYFRKAKRPGRPKKEFRKELMTLRVNHFVLRFLRSSGKGWQTRVSDWISEGVRSGALGARRNQKIFQIAKEKKC
ncbi:MAG: BrnA antitoxin family protein, partial [Candidatus Margulisbacteria bacterium]|nr:BrnA antitoxin family protein [Candidatus Margulisiibacteriota bacterium]